MLKLGGLKNLKFYVILLVNLTGNKLICTIVLKEHHILRFWCIIWLCGFSLLKLSRQDLKETFIDSGVMSAIKEWLSPLPDRSLPALKIREELLKILQEVWNWLSTIFDSWLLHGFTVMCFREMFGDKCTAAATNGLCSEIHKEANCKIDVFV